MTVILALPALSALQENTTASNVSGDANNSRSIAVADLDKDGAADIVVANEDNELNFVYYGDGAGSFGAGVALGNSAETSDSVDVADINADGFLDIVIGNRSGTQSNRIYTNNGDRTFTNRTTEISDALYINRHTSTVRFGDLNVDGEPDVVVINRNNTASQVFYGNVGAAFGFGGDGVLPPDNMPESALTDSSSAAIGNLTLDACPDIVVANRRNARNDLYVNRGPACNDFNTRRDLSPDMQYSDWIEIADLNNDNVMDVIVGNRQQPNIYLLGTGVANLDNLFEPSRQISSDADYTRDIRAVDVDGDGDQDIITANDSQTTNKVYLNQFAETGSVGFSEAISLTNDMTESIAVGVCGPNADPLLDCDLDGDGDIDLVFANNGTTGQGAINRVNINNNENPAFVSTPIEGATSGVAYTYNIIAEDADLDQALTITSAATPAWLTFTDNGGGLATLTGTPGAGDVGGGAGNTVSLSASDGALAAGQNFIITVDATNAAPTITSTAPDTIEETGDTAYAYAITTDDGDGDAVVITAPIAPSWLALTDAGDGTASLDSIAGRPNQGDVGDHNVEVRVTDPAGAAGIESFVLTVTDGNDAPIAVADYMQIAPGATVTVLGPAAPDYSANSVLWNDSDPDGDAISVARVSDPPNNGTVTVNPDGTFSYVHDGTVPVNDNFEYVLRDGDNAQDRARVNITGIGVQVPPTAVDDAYNVPNGGSIAGTPTVLANDTDANGDPLTAVLVTGPANDTGAFALNADGTFTYTHDGSATATDSFTYQANDGTANSGTATVTLTIDAPLDTTPPVITLLGNATVNVTTGGTYTDAGATATDDVDGDLTASIVANNPVDTAVPGSYVVTFDVSDAAGNAATQVTRNVIVADAPPPPPPPPPPPSGGGGGFTALLELLGLMFLVVMSRRKLRVARRSI